MITYDLFLVIVFQIPLLLEVKLTINIISNECHALGISRSPMCQWELTMKQFPQIFFETQDSSFSECCVIVMSQKAFFHKLQIINSYKFHTHHRAFRLLGEHQPPMVPQSTPPWVVMIKRLTADPNQLIRIRAHPPNQVSMLQWWSVTRGLADLKTHLQNRPVVFQKHGILAKVRNKNNSRFWEIWENHTGQVTFLGI